MARMSVAYAEVAPEEDNTLRRSRQLMPPH